ncbi:hypothetical protein LIER_29493 [Lithospermum erythrorhizon]
MSLKQKLGEPLRDYSNRFQRVLTYIPSIDKKVSMVAFFHGLQFGPLKQRLVLEPVTNVHQLSQLTVKYIKLGEAKNVAEGAIEVHPRSELRRSPKRKPVWGRLQKNPKKRQFPSEAQMGMSPRRENGRVRHPREPIYTSYTSLRTSIGKVYTQMEDRKLLPKPQKLRSPPNRRDLKLFCEYHKGHGHDTNDCRLLKAEFEKLIRRGHLKEFVRERSPRPLRDSPSRNVKLRSQSSPRITGRIDMISGGLAGGGNTSNSRK